MPFLFSLFSFYLLGAAITWFIGYALIRLLKSTITFGRNQYSSFFIESLLGYLFVSSITALISTKGNTVMWLVLVGLTALLVSNRILTDVNLDESKRSTFALVLISFTFLLSFSSFVVLNDFPVSLEDVILNGDFSFYGKLSKSLIETGKESSMTVHSHFMKIQGNEAYHYGDLWYTAIYSKIFGLSSNVFLMFGSYPTLFAIGIIGLIGWFKNQSISSSLFNYITILILIFGCSFILPFEFDWLNKAKFSYSGIIGMETKSIKTLILFPLVVLIFTFLDFKHKFKLVSILLIGMGVYSSVVPAFTGFGFSFLLICYLEKVENGDRLLSLIKDKSVWLFVVGVIFIVIYGLTTTGLYEYSPVLFEITKYEAIISSIEYFTYPYLVFLIVPFGLVILIIRDGLEKYLLVCVILITTSCASIVYIMLNIFNSEINQVLLNLALPLFVVTSIYIYSKFELNPIAKYSFILVLLISSYFNLKSSTLYKGSDNVDSLPSVIFRKNVMDSFTKERSNWVVISKKPWWKWSYSWTVPGRFIMANRHSSYPLDITKVLNGGFIPQFEISPYAKKGFNIDSFLTDNQFNFLYSEDEALIPERIKPIIQKLYLDSITGHVFYEIKR
tara:strand:- start:421 stop:2268 length:1848 start_codon:yes stop_codon:yes gene_type:complete